MKIQITKKNLYIFGAVFIGLMFLFGVLTQRITEAQVLSNYGTECKLNAGTCKSGYSLVKSSTIQYLGLTAEQFYRSKDIEYKDDPNFGKRNLNFSDFACIDSTTNGVIAVLIGNRNEIAAGNELDIYNGKAPAGYYRVARSCGTGTSPMQSKFVGADSDQFPFVGCCLPGYVPTLYFENPGGYVSYEKTLGTDSASCCSVVGGTKPGDAGYPVGSDGTTCFSIDPNHSNLSAERVNLTTRKVAGTITAIAGSVVQPNGKPPYPMGDKLGFSYRNTSKPNGNWENVIASTHTGAPKTCGTGFECASTDPQANNIINSDDLDTNPALDCSKCYTDQEPIKIVDTNGRKQLEFCGVNAAVTYTDIIRDSVTETLAYLRASAENRPLLDQCRDRGGVWVAIGCIDTTPLGLITGIIRIAFGTMGGVALAQMIYAGILFIIGEEKKIEEAKKQLIATFTGIAVLVFSILILRILGVNVLDILPQGSI